jgi:predicted secreted protein
VIPLLLVAASLAHAAPAPKTVTASANGTTVTIAPHQLLRIKLDEASDGGLEWLTTVKPDPAVLAHRKTRRTSPPCPTPDGQACPVGAPVTVYFRYVGKASGETKLRLSEYRFGRRSSKPAESFRLTVRVR